MGDNWGCVTCCRCSQGSVVHDATATTCLPEVVPEVGSFSKPVVTEESPLIARGAGDLAPDATERDSSGQSQMVGTPPESSEAVSVQKERTHEKTLQPACEDNELAPGKGSGFKRTGTAQVGEGGPEPGRMEPISLKTMRSKSGSMRSASTLTITSATLSADTKDHPDDTESDTAEKMWTPPKKVAQPPPSVSRGQLHRGGTGQVGLPVGVYERGGSRSMPLSDVSTKSKGLSKFRKYMRSSDALRGT